MGIIYMISSILFAVFFFRGLGHYDGSRPDSRGLNKFYSNPHIGFDEKMHAMHQLGIRRSLSGSWFRAIWMFGLWSSIPIVFYGIPPFAGFLFAMPGGWALAVRSLQHPQTLARLVMK